MSFPRDLAKEVAPAVRTTLAGPTFRSQNKSALDATFKATYEDVGKGLCKALLMDTSIAKDGMKAAKEYLQVAESKGVDFTKDLIH